MVGGHELDGARRKDARAVELAAVREHLREAVVVFGRGNQAAAAGGLRGLARESRHAAAVGGVGDCRPSWSVVFVERGEAGALVGGDIEAGVVHAERREDVVAHEVGQRLAGELFDDVALDVHRQAVDPACAGLIESGACARRSIMLLKVAACRSVQFVIHLVDRACRHCRR